MYNKTRGCSNSMLRYSDANSSSWISVLHSDWSPFPDMERWQQKELEKHKNKNTCRKNVVLWKVVGGGWWLLVSGGGWWWLLAGGGTCSGCSGVCGCQRFSSRYPLEPTCVSIINTPSVARASLVLNMLKTRALFRPVRTTVAMFSQRGSQGTQSPGSHPEVTRKSVTSTFPSLSVSVSALIQDHPQRVQKLRCVLGVFQSNGSHTHNASGSFRRITDLPANVFDETPTRSKHVCPV